MVGADFCDLLLRSRSQVDNDGLLEEARYQATRVSFKDCVSGMYRIGIMLQARPSETKRSKLISILR